MKVKCPECGKKMHKDGHVWQGRHKVQRYKCWYCGRSTIKTGNE